EMHDKLYPAQIALLPYTPLLRPREDLVRRAELATAVVREQTDTHEQEQGKLQDHDHSTPDYCLLRVAEVLRREQALHDHVVDTRSEEHTSEPSHVKISYAVFCLK